MTNPMLELIGLKKNFGGLMVVDELNLVVNSCEILRAVMELCHRITVVNFGRKIAEDMPENIRRNPAVIEAYLGDS